MADAFRLRINNLGCLDALVVCLHRTAVGRHLAKLLGYVISTTGRDRSLREKDYLVIELYRS